MTEPLPDALRPRIRSLQTDRCDNPDGRFDLAAFAGKQAQIRTGAGIAHPGEHADIASHQRSNSPAKLNRDIRSLHPRPGHGSR